MTICFLASMILRNNLSEGNVWNRGIRGGSWKWFSGRFTFMRQHWRDGNPCISEKTRHGKREFLHDFSLPSKRNNASKKSIERQGFHQFTFVEGWKLVWLFKKLYICMVYVKKNREIYLCLETHVFLLYLLVEIWWTCQYISSKDSANLGKAFPRESRLIGPTWDVTKTL